MFSTQTYLSLISLILNFNVILKPTAIVMIIVFPFDIIIFFRQRKEKRYVEGGREGSIFENINYMVI